MTCTERKRKNSPHQPVGRWIRVAKRLAIYLRDDFKCIYCLRDLRDADPRDVHLDHLRPRCDGGSNHETNLVTACASCNDARGDKPIEQFASPEASRRVARNIARPLARYLTLAKALIAGCVGTERS